MRSKKNMPVELTLAEKNDRRIKTRHMALTAAGCLAIMGTLYMISPEIAYAAGKASGASAVTSSFSSLTDIVTALVSSIGTIVLLWGFFEWGTSMQSTDGVMQSSAFKRIGGGLIMVLAPQLISAFVS